MKKFFVVLLLCIAAFAAPTVHQVGLSWSQSTSSGLTGNCVYRGAVSGGPYTQLSCSSAPVTTYTDTSVVGGQTYYYVVTAVSGTQESGYSNEFKAVIPLSPSAPTGLTGTVQ